MAVYEEMRMVVKNHQMPATMRDEAAFGFRSELLVATKGRIEKQAISDSMIHTGHLLNITKWTFII